MAARFFRNPNQESFDAFMLTCFPLYGRAPRDPDVRARVRLRPEVNFHFFGGELQTYNWFDDLNRIHCPTLILAGEVDPIATSWITRCWLPRSRGHGSRSFQTLDTACSATSPMRPLRLSAISSVLRVSQPRPLTYSATPALGRVVKLPDVVERTAR